MTDSPTHSCCFYSTIMRSLSFMLWLLTSRVEYLNRKKKLLQRYTKDSNRVVFWISTHGRWHNSKKIIGKFKAIIIFRVLVAYHVISCFTNLNVNKEYWKDIHVFIITDKTKIIILSFSFSKYYEILLCSIQQNKSISSFQMFYTWSDNLFELIWYEWIQHAN